MDADAIQNVYIRIARDSQFRMDHIEVAKLAGAVLALHPFEVYCTFPYMDVMKDVAEGNHPVLIENGGSK